MELTWTFVLSVTASLLSTDELKLRSLMLRAAQVRAVCRNTRSQFPYFAAIGAALHDYV